MTRNMNGLAIFTGTLTLLLALFPGPFQTGCAGDGAAAPAAIGTTGGAEEREEPPAAKGDPPAALSSEEQRAEVGEPISDEGRGKAPEEAAPLQEGEGEGEGEDEGEGDEAPTLDPKVVPKVVEGSCIEGGCHKEQVSFKHLHDPVSEEDCESCHERDGDEHVFEEIEASEELCMECHDEFEGEVIHEVMEDGDCGICHDSHGGPTEKFLTEPDMKTLCGDCHEEVFEKEVLHGPLNDDECISCHKIHAGEHEKLLLQEKVTEVCNECHDEILDDASEHPSIHEPIKEECTGCHDPHCGKDERFLIKEGPELCLSCHEEMAAELKNAKVVHGVWKTEADSCLHCHLPHSGEKAKLIGDKGDSCLDCHDDEVKTKAGRKIPAFSAVMAEGRHLHDPVKRKDCATCHDPHYSVLGPALLKGSYPMKNYAAWGDGKAYETCFKCHGRTAFESEEGGRTNFKDGERNLHYLHVKREKGRTCSFCHDPHAAGNDRLMRETYAFGKKGWQLKLGFESNGNGGRCSPGCHKAKDYSPKNRVTPELLETEKGEGAEEKEESPSKKEE